MKRFDVAEQKSQPASNGPSATNGTKRRSTPSGSESPKDGAHSSPPPKKHKKDRSVQESDAAYAARLQAEENGRARSTRNAGVPTKRKSAAKKDKARKKKLKSKNTVGSDDDSDAADTGGEKKINRTGGFHVSDVHGRPTTMRQANMSPETNVVISASC